MYDVHKHDVHKGGGGGGVILHKHPSTSQSRREIDILKNIATRQLQRLNAQTLAKTNLEAADAESVDGARQSPVDQRGEPAALRRHLPPHASGKGVPQQLRQHADLVFGRAPGASELLLYNAINVTCSGVL